MKGRVLGCDGSGCVINGDDGARYQCASADWKGTRPPQPRDEVDFVTSGARATDVYPVQGGPALAVQGLDGDAGRKALGVLRDRPQVILATLLIVASFLFVFVQVKGFGDTPQWKSTAVALPGKVGAVVAMARDTVKSAADSAAQMRVAMTSFGQPAPSGPPALAPEDQAKVDQMNTPLNLSRLLALIYLVPAGAAAILFFEYRQGRRRLIEILTGAIALLSVAAAFYVRSLAAQGIGQALGTGTETFKQAFQLGLGGWLFALCGAALIATGLGYLRRTPGLPG